MPKRTTLPPPEKDPVFIGDVPNAAERIKDLLGSKSEPEPLPLYTPVKWKGVKDVYMCATCKHCEDKEPDMQLHVLNHFPESEREGVLNKLIQGDNHG